MPWLISFVLALSSCQEREASENYKMKTSWSKLDMIQQPSAYWSEAITTAQRIHFDGIRLKVNYIHISFNV